MLLVLLRYGGSHLWKSPGSGSIPPPRSPTRKSVFESMSGTQDFSLHTCAQRTVGIAFQIKSFSNNKLHPKQTCFASEFSLAVNRCSNPSRGAKIYLYNAFTYDERQAALQPLQCQVPGTYRILLGGAKATMSELWHTAPGLDTG
jgi:hypothetical protein